MGADVAPGRPHALGTRAATPGRNKGNDFRVSGARVGVDMSSFRPFAVVESGAE